MTIDQLFQALSGPIRIQIIERLDEKELCCTELSELLNIKQSRLGFHINTLKNAGLITVRPQQRYRYYSINREKFNELKTYLSTF